MEKNEDRSLAKPVGGKVWVSGEVGSGQSL